MNKFQENTIIHIEEFHINITMNDLQSIYIREEFLLLHEKIPNTIIFNKKWTLSLVMNVLHACLKQLHICMLGIEFSFRHFWNF